MSNLVAGLLGGAMGAGSAMNEVGKSALEDLRTRLRDEALAELQAKRDERQHGYNKELSKEERESRVEEGRLDRESAEGMYKGKIASAEGISSAGIKSAEKIASDKNAMLERLAKAENALKKDILAEDKKGNTAQEMRATVAAYAEARRVIEGGGSTDEANAVLEAVGLPGFEEFVTDPGSKGFFGFGGTPPTVGRRIEGQTGGAGVSNDLESLLALGRNADAPRTTPRKDPVAGSGNETPGAAQGPEPRPKPKGILGGETILHTKTDIDPDPKNWDVRNEVGQYFMITKDGPVKMTAQQIDQWKAATSAK